MSSVRGRIDRACALAGRNPADITLVAVSKTRPAEAIRDAFRHGLVDIGENYLQEAVEKIESLRDLDICWHYIGRIQSSKTREIASHFHWAHGVDRIKVARRLSEQRPAGLAPLNICLQINVSAEDSKGGARPDQLMELAGPISAMTGVRIRGLMGMPAAASTPEQQHRDFAQMQALLAELREQVPEADTLSMGMSADLEAAIANGSTMVRIGRAIFGERL